jgi:outer membrane protein assembly factor BamB
MISARALQTRCPILMMLVLCMDAGAVRADDWPQWLGPQRDGVWREAGLIDKFPEQGPSVRWRTPVSEGYAGPAVAHGRVIITDRVRPKGVDNPDDPFGTPRVVGSERVLCLDEATGKVLWRYEYECPYEISYAAGPRTTPVIADGKVYTFGAMGHLCCLDLNSGRLEWQHHLPSKYNFDVPKWGMAGHPLVDGNRLICLAGGKGSVAVAFDKNTGSEVWKALSASEPGYAPPMIYVIDDVRQLIIWHPDGINSLNPETGEVYWSQRYGTKRTIKAGLTIPTPRLAGDRLFFTAFYDGPLLLKVNGTTQPDVLWSGKGRGEKPEFTDGLHSIMSTPTLKDGHIYGVCSYGELRCLDAATGKRIWSTHAATTGESTRWGNAFLVRIDNTDRYVLFNERGDLILAELTPKGYREINRAHILEPTNKMAGPPGRRVIWSHPAFANRCVYARNDREIVCVSFAKE